jgi:hypothetical protein
MHVLVMIFSEDAQAQSALTTLGLFGVGSISVVPGVEVSADDRRHPCLHAFCLLHGQAAVEGVRDLLARTVGPPAGSFARWAILPAVPAEAPEGTLAVITR